MEQQPFDSVECTNLISAKTGQIPDKICRLGWPVFRENRPVAPPICKGCPRLGGLNVIYNEVLARR